MKLSIVIVSYNTKNILLDCLGSIGKFLGSTTEVIVVDNDSKDGSGQAIKEKFKWVKVIEVGENLGFGKANNVGAKIATGEYLLFLNSDTLLVENLDKIVEFLDKHEEVGALGPRLVLEDGKSEDTGLGTQGPGVEGPEQEGAYGRDPRLGNLITRKMMYQAELNGEGFAEVDWVTGAALFIRRKLFEELGGFDERYFFFFEDADLCRQVRIHGCKVVWYPESKIIHLGGRSIVDNWSRKQIYYKNQEVYFEKYYGKMSVYLLKLIRWPYVIIQMVKIKM